MFKKAKEFKKKLAAYYKEEENKKVAIFLCNAEIFSHNLLN